MSQLVLSAPVIITPRLLPGVRVGDAFISIERADDITRDNRDVYRYYIDIPGAPEYSADDISSGVGGGSLQSGLSALVSFLSACGESVRYRDGGHGDGENSDLFPGYIGEFCAANSDDLAMCSIELEENDSAIVEND